MIPVFPGFLSRSHQFSNPILATRYGRISFSSFWRSLSGVHCRCAHGGSTPQVPGDRIDRRGRGFAGMPNSTAFDAFSLQCSVLAGFFFGLWLCALLHQWKNWNNPRSMKVRAEQHQISDRENGRLDAPPAEDVVGKSSTGRHCSCCDNRRRLRGSASDYLAGLRCLKVPPICRTFTRQPGTLNQPNDEVEGLSRPSEPVITLSR